MGDDVRGTYDTYVERLDSLLLLNALILPFALNTLQFSDQFIPGSHGCDPEDLDSCIVVRHPWLHSMWIYLVGIDLFLPFWAILLLLQCKGRLDTWLQSTLTDLQRMRRAIINVDTNLTNPSVPKSSKQIEDELADYQQRLIGDLGGFIVSYQDMFSQFWTTQCGPLVDYATWLLLCSATVAIALTSYMFWIFLASRSDYLRHDHLHFLGITAIGFLIPGLLFSRSRLSARPGPVQERTPEIAISPDWTPNTAPRLAREVSGLSASSSTPNLGARDVVRELSQATIASSSSHISTPATRHLTASGGPTLSNGTNEMFAPLRDSNDVNLGSGRRLPWCQHRQSGASPRNV